MTESIQTLQQIAAEQGPRWNSRKEAWVDGYRHGELQARMTGGSASLTEIRERFRVAAVDDDASPLMLMAAESWLDAALGEKHGPQA